MRILGKIVVRTRLNFVEGFRKTWRIGLETCALALVARNSKLVTRNPKLVTRNPQPETRNSQPVTRNPKLVTRNS